MVRYRIVSVGCDCVGYDIGAHREHRGGSRAAAAGQVEDCEFRVSRAGVGDPAGARRFRLSDEKTPATSVGGVFRLRRALQRDAQHRCRAFWAAHHERARNPKTLRARLGLTRKGIEAAAKTHIEASGWMRDHLTKAIGLHVADEV